MKKIIVLIALFMACAGAGSRWESIEMQVLWENKIDNATLTASSEAANYPVENLQDPRLSRPWRSTGGAAEWAKAAVTAKATRAALIDHKLSSSAVIRLQADMFDDFTDPLLNDLVTWREGTIVQEIEDVARSLLTSWTPDTAGHLRGMAYGAGLWVSVGDAGNIQTSPDKINWTTRTPDGGFSGDFYGIVFGNNLFWLVGTDGEIQSSSDGINYTQLQTALSGAHLYCVHYADGYFVVMGIYHIISSPNGVDITIWYNATSPDSINSLTFGNGLWAASTQTNPGKILTFSTSDMIAQSGLLSNSLGSGNVIKCLIYANNLFVGAGDLGKLVNSSDGIIWTISTLSAGMSYNCIAYGNNVFVIAGEYGEIQISSNGTNFMHLYDDYFYSKSYRGIAYALNCFMLCGINLFGSNATDILRYASNSTFPYWRLLITDSVTGYVQIGKWYLGEYLQLPGMRIDQEIGDETESEVTIGAGGQAYGNDDYIFRPFNINFPYITNEQRDSIRAMFAVMKNIRPMTIVIWANETIEPPAYCLIDQNKITWKHSDNVLRPWSTSIKWREVK